MNLEFFISNGIRVALSAEPLLSQLSEEDVEAFKKKVLDRKILYLTKDLAEEILNEIKAEKQIEGRKIVINRAPMFKPIAKEYSSNIIIDHKRDVTGKSRTTGSVNDFVEHFRNRYKRLRALFHHTYDSKYSEVAIEDLNTLQDQYVRLIVMVYSKSITKNGNVLLEIEDLTGRSRAIISKSNEELFLKSNEITNDDVIAIYGRVRQNFLIVEDFEFPDVPINKSRPNVEADIAVAYISDIHFGSRFFLDKLFERFIKFLNGGLGNEKLAGKIKYLVVAGDVVDGIGIYPGQEKELTIKDVYEQYALFDRFIELIPDYIDVIVLPGNHDAVRRAEPMPAIDKSLISSDVKRVGNPAFFSLEGVKHLAYHGTSLDSIIASIPKLSYEHPAKAMIYYLKKRHLSPIYGTNPIVPEKIDYLVMDIVPDVVHMGHVHKNDYSSYKGVILINSGTFQDQTTFQLKQGHVPTPGEIPILELKHWRLTRLNVGE